MSRFQVYIGNLIRRYGTAQALAEAIDMSPSAFARGVRNNNTLGVESLLRLAEVVGDSPVTVLRLAGKDAAADAVERLASPNHRPLSEDDRFLLALDPDAKRQLRRLVEGLTPMARARG